MQVSHGKLRRSCGTTHLARVELELARLASLLGRPALDARHGPLFESSSSSSTPTSGSRVPVALAGHLLRGVDTRVIPAGGVAVLVEMLADAPVTVKGEGESVRRRSGEAQRKESHPPRPPLGLKKRANVVTRQAVFYAIGAGQQGKKTAGWETCGRTESSWRSLSVSRWFTVTILNAVRLESSFSCLVGSMSGRAVKSVFGSTPTR